MKGRVMNRFLRFFAALAFVLMGSKLSFGRVLVYGEVDEQDWVTPIENATVTFSGVDVAGDTVVYHITTDTQGYFADSINAGMYRESRNYKAKWILFQEVHKNEPYAPFPPSI